MIYEETRYPAIKVNDYWNVDDYMEGKGLIRNYKLFHRHPEGLYATASFVPYRMRVF